VPSSATSESASELIDARIAELADWRGEILARVRDLIRKSLPDVVEEWKWRGVPVWSQEGMICTGESYKNYVKVTFAKGAALEDPAGLFNASLDGNVRRAIDLHEDDKIDARAFTSLVRAAAALNAAKAEPKRKAQKATTTKGKAKAPASKGKARTAKASSGSEKPKLLSGGNPQIPMGYGDEPVQAYIEAMPGWKSDVGRRLDSVIERAVPEVRKAVKWNSPFYGIEGQGWFTSYHCFAKYIKVTFFDGASLRPPPPEASKDEGVRYFHVHEDDEIDEDQLTTWMRQAAELPGWVTSDIAET
jgi:hypothetical protein